MGQWRNWLISFLHSQGLIGLPVLVVVCASLAGLAGFLVSRLEPAAEGSGIPRTEAVVQGRLNLTGAGCYPLSS